MTVGSVIGYFEQQLCFRLCLIAVVSEALAVSKYRGKPVSNDVIMLKWWELSVQLALV